MQSVNRLQTTPVNVRKSRRNHDGKVLTSAPPGKMVPVFYAPILREDAFSGVLNLAVEMHETVELLLNPVHVTFSAYVVPHLANERFEGSVDQLNRSWAKEPKTNDEGADVIPYIERHAFGAHGANEIYKYIGLHGAPTQQVNTAVNEGYNLIWNMRATNRSKEIAKRLRLDTALAPAFWPRSRFDVVVPDFDQAVIDGEISLNLVNDRLPVRGIASSDTGTDFVTTSNAALRESGATTVGVTGEWLRSNASGSAGEIWVKESATAGFPEVYAEMASEGISLSLSNIELAKRTQWWAKKREYYNGKVGDPDEYIMKLLLNGIHIPDQSLKQPMLVGQAHTTIKQAKRFSTDAADLDESVTSGLATASLRIAVPPLHTGGILMIVAECVPEQLWERQSDPYFHVEDGPDGRPFLPEYMRDDLDPEKVEVVKNSHIDTSHADPDGTFGYAPLNWMWTRFGFRAGGAFYRPSANTAFDEDRQRLWVMERVNPKLAEDFYVVSEIHKKPFYDQTRDPFDIVLMGGIIFTGNTIFGGTLREATDDYDEVLAEAPQDRIVKEA